MWVNGAVGLTDSYADAAFLLVPVIGFVAAIVARFRPRRMARATFAAALAHALIGVSALIVPVYNFPLGILGLTGFFVVLFVGSALLFQQADRGWARRVAA